MHNVDFVVTNCTPPTLRVTKSLVSSIFFPVYLQNSFPSEVNYGAARTGEASSKEKTAPARIVRIVDKNPN